MKLTVRILDLLKPDNPSSEAQLRLLAQHFEGLPMVDLIQKSENMGVWAEPLRALAEFEIARRERSLEGVVGVKKFKQTMWRTGGNYRTPAAREETDVERMTREAQRAVRRANTAMWIALLGCVLQAISLLARLGSP